MNLQNYSSYIEIPKLIEYSSMNNLFYFSYKVSSHGYFFNSCVTRFSNSGLTSFWVSIQPHHLSSSWQYSQNGNENVLRHELKDVLHMSKSMPDDVKQFKYCLEIKPVKSLIIEWFFWKNIIDQISPIYIRQREDENCLQDFTNEGGNNHTLQPDIKNRIPGSSCDIKKVELVESKVNPWHFF